MKKLILIGRSGSGKTTLSKKMMGEELCYHKTQCVERSDWVIDTPGEYAESNFLAGALALYSYEADIVGLIISATEPYSLYSPNITGMVNREVVGIITKTDLENANAPRAERWLRLAGCKKIFQVSAYSGEGVKELLRYLESKTK